MTIEQLIVQCLYENKSLTLQKIGSFKLSGEVLQETDGEKTAELPQGTIIFEANKNAEEDPALIDFIVLHTRKMKALAASDLDSYLSLQKQLLNIGNPLIIPGLGTLQKEVDGHYSFAQGRSVAKRIDKQADFKESAGNELISFKTEAKPKNSNKNTLAISAIILVVLLVAVGMYFILKHQNSNKTEDITPLSDTLNTEAPVNVAPVKKDSIQLSNGTDSSAYQVVIREYPNAAEGERMAATYKSYGHNIVLVQKNDIYKLTIPISQNFGDTTNVLDSLQKLFKFKTYILKQ